MERLIKHNISQPMRARIKELFVMESAPYAVPQDDVINALIDSGRIITLKRGEALISEGDYNPDFYMLIDGIMRKWHWNEDVEVTSAFAMPGTQILDYHCYHGGKNSVGNIEACCKSKLFAVSKDAYDRMLAGSIEFSNWRLQMAYNQLYYMEMKQHVITGDARERYLAMAKTRKEIIQKVPLKIIATYLGITPQYLSYLRKSLSQ